MENNMKREDLKPCIVTIRRNSVKPTTLLNIGSVVLEHDELYKRMIEIEKDLNKIGTTAFFVLGDDWD